MLLSQYYNEFNNYYNNTYQIRFLATEIKDEEDKQVKTITRFQEDDFTNFKKIIVLTTYISAPVIYETLVENTVSIDLVIHDEAHHIHAPLYNKALESCKHNITHQLNLSATLPRDSLVNYRYSLLQGIKDEVVRNFDMQLFLCTSRDKHDGVVIEKMIHKLISLHGNKNVRLLIYTFEANTTHESSSSVCTFLTRFSHIFKKK